MVKKLTKKEVLDATPEDEKDEVLAIFKEANNGRNDNE